MLTVNNFIKNNVFVTANNNAFDRKKIVFIRKQTGWHNITKTNPNKLQFIK